jgi:hypothetical protein
MSTAPLRRLPALASTGVGSLPFAGAAEAISHMADAYELPFCPQLPRRDGDMLQEWLGSDPGHCGWTRDRDREHPAAWSAFVARMRRDPPSHRIVKLQVTGPVTLATALERAAGRPGSGADATALAAEVSGWLAASAAAQVRELAELRLDVLLMVDEPGIAGAGLSADHVAVWDPLRAVSAAWGLHICGALPWPLIDAAAPDALSFDLSRGALEPAAYPILARLAARGGRIVWGVVDPVAPGDPAVAAARLIAAMASLGTSCRADEVAQASLVSPACGSGRLSVDSERRLAGTVAATLGAVRDGLAAISGAASARGRSSRSRCPGPDG